MLSLITPPLTPTLATAAGKRFSMELVDREIYGHCFGTRISSALAGQTLRNFNNRPVATQFVAVTKSKQENNK